MEWQLAWLADELTVFESTVFGSAAFRSTAFRSMVPSAG
jgi:hypothetical protein